VIVHRHRMKAFSSGAVVAHYSVTHFWLFVKSFMLKWLLQPLKGFLVPPLLQAYLDFEKWGGTPTLLKFIHCS